MENFQIINSSFAALRKGNLLVEQTKVRSGVVGAFTSSVVLVRVAVGALEDVGAVQRGTEVLDRLEVTADELN